MPLPDDADNVETTARHRSYRMFSYLPWVDDFWSTHFEVEDLAELTWTEASTPGIYQQAAGEYTVSP